MGSDQVSLSANPVHIRDCDIPNSGSAAVPQFPYPSSEAKTSWPWTHSGEIRGARPKPTILGQRGDRPTARGAREGAVSATDLGPLDPTPDGADDVSQGDVHRTVFLASRERV